MRAVRVRSIVLGAIAAAFVASVVVKAPGITTLPTGWRIRGAEGAVATVGTMPHGIVVSRDGSRVIELEAGYRKPALRVLDATTLKEPPPRPPPRRSTRPGRRTRNRRPGPRRSRSRPPPGRGMSYSWAVLSWAGPRSACIWSSAAAAAAESALVIGSELYRARRNRPAIRTAEPEPDQPGPGSPGEIPRLGCRPRRAPNPPRRSRAPSRHSTR